jgi:hypothetical protein
MARLTPVAIKTRSIALVQRRRADPVKQTQRRRNDIDDGVAVEDALSQRTTGATGIGGDGTALLAPRSRSATVRARRRRRSKPQHLFVAPGSPEERP